MKTQVLSASERDTVEAAYLEQRKLLRSIAYRFASYARMDPEECLSLVTYHFTETHRTWDPNQGPLETRLRRVLWSRLVEYVRRESRQVRIRKRLRFGKSLRPVLAGRERESDDTPDDDSGDLIPGYYTPTPALPFDPDQFRHVSERAFTLLQLILDTPPELDAKIRQNPHTNDSGVRMALRSHLLELGWSYRQIADAWSEIQKFL